VIYLDLAELLHIADRTLGQVDVRDMGLLESALARPRTTIFGEDAYPDLAHKAAGLTQSVTKNHALVDGNKRLALAALIAFLGLNGLRLTFSNDGAYDFIIEIAAGGLADVPDIAAVIAGATEPW
jgi:death-on-curing protein